MVLLFILVFIFNNIDEIPNNIQVNIYEIMELKKYYFSYYFFYFVIQYINIQNMAI